MTSTPREDSPFQPALRRRDSAWRYAIVLVFAAFVMVAGPEHSWWWVVVQVAVAVVSLVMVRFRRRWPATVGVAANLMVAVSYTAFGAAALATVSVSTRRRRREIVMISISILVAWTIMYFTQEPPSDDMATSWQEDLVTTVLLSAALVIWGLYIGSRRVLVGTLRERADRLENEQELRTKQARDAERAQIAREMHDVLAHRISQISMQAGAIAFRTDLDADQLRQAAAALQTNAHAALVDLRGVLGVLRDPNSGEEMDAPQPRASDIDDLIAQARADGSRVHAEVNIGAGIDETIGRTLYRITQESITNARKHAPLTTVSIIINASPEDGVSFRAHNPLPVGNSRSAVPESGFGLIGLAERAELAGGTLKSSRTPDGFTVSAQLPWEPETAASTPEYAR